MCLLTFQYAPGRVSPSLRPLGLPASKDARRWEWEMGRIGCLLLRWYAGELAWWNEAVLWSELWGAKLIVWAALKDILDMNCGYLATAVRWQLQYISMTTWIKGPSLIRLSTHRVHF